MSVDKGKRWRVPACHPVRRMPARERETQTQLTLTHRVNATGEADRQQCSGYRTSKREEEGKAVAHQRQTEAERGCKGTHRETELSRASSRNKDVCVADA